MMDTGTAFDTTRQRLDQLDGAQGRLKVQVSRALLSAGPLVVMGPAPLRRATRATQAEQSRRTSTRGGTET